MVVAVSLVLWSVTGSLTVAFFIAVMLLPGVMFVKYFVGDLSFKNRWQGILHTVYFVAIVMLIEYMAIAWVYRTVSGYDKSYEMPDIVTNPLFIWLVLGASLSIEYLLKIKLFKREAPIEQYISFTSDRKKVSLEINYILYIESRDYEVQVVTVSGVVYPTRMKISQWESVLDNRFVRTHRSFIVNRLHVSRFDTRTVWLGETQIEISRKYRETAVDKLDKPIVKK
jgi:DNA-binding LytR/AlgR family response regulator